MGCRNLKELRDLFDIGSEPWKTANDEYLACLRNEAIAAILDRVSRLMARKAALQYIQCRLGGGSVAECMGFYDLVVPPPPVPHFPRLRLAWPASQRNAVPRSSWSEKISSGRLLVRCHSPFSARRYVRHSATIMLTSPSRMRSRSTSAIASTASLA